MDTLVRLIRIILPAQIFLVIGGLLSAALQAQDRHFLPAMAPLVYSACIIVGGLVGAHYPEWEPKDLPGACWLAPLWGPSRCRSMAACKTRMRWYPILSFWNRDLRRYLWLSFPIMIGFSIVVVDEWIVKNQASYLARRRAVLSAIRPDTDESADRRVRHGGRCGSLSNAEPYGRRRTSGRGVWPGLSALCGLMLFVTFRSPSVHDIGGRRGGIFGLGLFSSRFSVADAQATGTVLAFLCLGLGGWASQTVISRGFYAFGSTWLPTIVGTLIAFLVGASLRRAASTMGAHRFGIASSVAILIYVLLLGWLQYRRFEWEAAARDTNLKAVPGMLGAAFGLAVATGLAIGAGLYLRYLLLQFLPGMQILAILMRATVLCAFGIAIYLAVARLLGVTELARLQRLLSRRLMRSR